MPCPQYVRTTEQPFWRAMGSLVWQRQFEMSLVGERSKSNDVHRLAQVAEQGARLAELDGLVETLARGAHEPEGVIVHSADGIRFVQVPVVA